jgi:ABC-type transport system involved in multi-copper enzyme maturation permease subunit
MIATIKSEWRKNRFRPAMLASMAVMAVLPVLGYGVLWYEATHPGNSDHPVMLASLYPDQFVVVALSATFPLGAALAIVLGALVSGSDYNWGTLETVLTQGPSRVTYWAGRVVVFAFWVALTTVASFVTAALSSTIIAIAEGHAITWPALDVVIKAAAAIWLILLANGTIGLALGVAIRQSAMALGIGLVYFLSVEGIALRFIDSLNNGAYQWVGNLFIDQNAYALLQHFFADVTARLPITESQSVAVLVTYAVALTAVGAALLRQRDVT